MKSLETVTMLFADLDSGELAGWIAQRWVQPEPDDRGGWAFRDIDIARTRLIYDLRRDLETPEATMPVVLSLLDQIYELRRVVDGLGQALAGLPPDIRTTLEAKLAAIAESGAPR